MPDRTVRIILTGSSAGAVRALKVTGDAAEATQGKLARLKETGHSISGVGHSMIALAAPTLALGGYAVKSAMDFQQSMELIRTQAGQSQGEVNRLSRAVLNLAPSVATAPKDLAESLYHIESAGFHGAKALKMLKIAAEGTKIGGPTTNIAEVTTALNGAVVTGIPGVKNFSQAMAVMNKTVGEGDMHMSDLADAFSTGGLAPLKFAGLTFREVAASLAAMGDANVRGQDAMTKLVSAMRVMGAPAKANAEWLAKIGMTQLQLSTDMHSGPNGLLVALEDLHKHLKGLSKPEMQLVLTRIFGGRQSAGVQILLDQLDRLKVKYADFGKGLSTQSAFDATKNNPAFKFQQMKATLDADLIKLGNALMPIVLHWLPKFTKVIGDALTWLTHLPKSVKDILFWFTAFLAIGGPILIFVGKLVTAVSTIAGVFKLLGGPLGKIVGTLLPGLELGLGEAGLMGSVAKLAGGFVRALGPLGLFVAGLLWANKNIPFVHNALMDLGIGIRKLLGLPYAGQKPNDRGMIDGPGGKKIHPHALPGFMNAPGGGAIKPNQQLRPRQVGNGWWVLPDGSRLKPNPGWTVSPQGTLVRAHHLGGLIRGMAEGGYLGGFGGGDRRLRALEDGEFVLRKETTRAIGVNALNSINQSGGMAGQGAQQTMEVTMPVTLRISNGRVLAEEVVRFAARKSSMSGHWVTG